MQVISKFIMHFGVKNPEVLDGDLTSGLPLGSRVLYLLWMTAWNYYIPVVPLESFEGRESESFKSEQDYPTLLDYLYRVKLQCLKVQGLESWMCKVEKTVCYYAWEYSKDGRYTEIITFTISKYSDCRSVRPEFIRFACITDDFARVFIDVTWDILVN